MVGCLTKTPSRRNELHNFNFAFVSPIKLFVKCFCGLMSPEMTLICLDALSVTVEYIAFCGLHTHTHTFWANNILFNRA